MPKRGLISSLTLVWTWYMIQRQLLVAAVYLVAHQVGDHLLVRGAQAEFALVAVVDSQQFWDRIVPSARIPATARPAAPPAC